MSAPIIREDAKKFEKKPEPQVYTAAELLALDLPDSGMMIDPILPSTGLIMVVGPAKTGKTILCVQTAVAVSSGCDLFTEFPILIEGPVLIVEVDDPSGQRSI